MPQLGRSTASNGREHLVLQEAPPGGLLPTDLSQQVAHHDGRKRGSARRSVGVTHNAHLTTWRRLTPMCRSWAGNYREHGPGQTIRPRQNPMSPQSVKGREWGVRALSMRPLACHATSSNSRRRAFISLLELTGAGTTHGHRLSTLATRVRSTTLRSKAEVRRRLGGRQAGLSC